MFREEETLTTGHEQGSFRLSSRAVVSGQAKEGSNCLPLRVYPDVLLSRLTGAKSEHNNLLYGRRTDARLGLVVVTIHSGWYWIINTLVIII
ncbi:hypothetical protein [Aneurinibacillus migulanus]|uniref:hypothetical protein n=1 Tax=Aneurinibacillus migulanus TaxID=47500 RepID=UPI001F370721|nr:hypothetical protein [Aneurinibacillus migulanus]